MGIYILFVTNGAHLAAVVGGFTARNPHLGWRWCYWVPAMIFAGTWVVILFCLPETLYHRDPSRSSLEPELPNQTADGGPARQGNNAGRWIGLLTFRTVFEKKRRKLRLKDFGRVFVMLRYPSVLLPAVYYSVSFGLGSVLFAVSDVPPQFLSW
jgi:MFS family permease